MEESLMFRMSAFSEQGGRKYMEDVVEIRIEYEPTASSVEDYPKSQRDGGMGGAEDEPAKQPVLEARGHAEPGGPAAVAWVQSLSTEDSYSISSPASKQQCAEQVVDTRKSVAFFAVFDGHGGREAAHFASEHLWDLLKRQRGFWSKDPGEVCAALRKGFIACHHAMWKELRPPNSNASNFGAIQSYSFESDGSSDKENEDVKILDASEWSRAGKLWPAHFSCSLTTESFSNCIDLVCS